MSFKNKVVIVTGASSGIGAAIALKFAEEGANVSIVGRQVNKLKNVSENIGKVGNKPLVIAADVTKEKDAQRIVNDTLKRFGKIDVLVNNAGRVEYVEVTEEHAIKKYDDLMAINLRSAVYLTHLSGKHLIETKGNIINISSVAAQFPMKKNLAYCTSKAALDHFSRSVALDFASKGVRVNVISPGPVGTDAMENMGITDAAVAEAEWEKFRLACPLKRLSDSLEMAELALFLASDRAVGITGSIYAADNGLLLERGL